ncbi:sensor histidine kinase [Pseudoalteromonas xiamenensis]|uniref:sensor histidine kinase n=1 Tax=Pseudoalteromonas xiamenensis TaxID=882626 RepID=UPI0035EBC645
MITDEGENKITLPWIKYLILITAYLLVTYSLMRLSVFDWLHEQEFQSLRHSIEEKAKKIQNHFVFLQEERSNWQDILKHDETVHIAAYSLQDLDVDTDTISILNSLQIGDYYIDPYELIAYLKVQPDKFIVIVDLQIGGTLYPVESANFLLGIIFAFIAFFILAWVIINTLKNHESLGVKCNDVSSLERVFTQLHTQKLKVENVSLLQRDLMYSVAHEIRSPLARIQFALDLLEPDVKTQTVHFSHDIEKAIVQLDSMASELLNYAKLEFANQSFSVKPVDISLLVRDCLENVEVHYRHIDFNMHVYPDEIILNAELVARALTNILRNAGRFANNQVKLYGHRVGVNFIITIEDDGPGVAPGKVERIFEPFTRLQSQTSKDSGGVGLGLAVTATIIRRHGGTINVSESALGGAKFTVTFFDQLK